MHSRCHGMFPAINALSLLLTLVPRTLSPSSMSVPGPHLSLPPTTIAGRQSPPIPDLQCPIPIPNGLLQSSLPANAHSRSPPPSRWSLNAVFANPTSLRSPPPSRPSRCPQCRLVPSTPSRRPFPVHTALPRFLSLSRRPSPALNALWLPLMPSQRPFPALAAASPPPTTLLGPALPHFLSLSRRSSHHSQRSSRQPTASNALATRTPLPDRRRPPDCPSSHPPISLANPSHLTCPPSPLPRSPSPLAIAPGIPVPSPVLPSPLRLPGASQSPPPLSCESLRDCPGPPSLLLHPLITFASPWASQSPHPSSMAPREYPWASQYPPSTFDSPCDRPGYPSPLPHPPFPSRGPRRPVPSTVLQVPWRSPRASQSPSPASHSTRDRPGRPSPPRPSLNLPITLPLSLARDLAHPVSLDALDASPDLSRPSCHPRSSPDPPSPSVHLPVPQSLRPSRVPLVSLPTSSQSRRCPPEPPNARCVFSRLGPDSR